MGTSAAKGGGELDPAQLALIRQAVANAKAAKMYVIVDVHNYAKYYGHTIGSTKVPISTFNDLWRRLAIAFKSDNAVIFGLMNEPYDIDPQAWATAAQASIDTIRKTGATNLILVPGALWTGAHSWYSTVAGQSNAVAMASIRDPLNRYAIEAHQYLDADSSGTSGGCVSATVGVERLRSFTEWLRLNKNAGFSPNSAPAIRSPAISRSTACWATWNPTAMCGWAGPGGRQAHGGVGRIRSTCNRMRKGATSRRCRY